jgi:hypothetical protein
VWTAKQSRGNIGCSLSVPATMVTRMNRFVPLMTALILFEMVYDAIDRVLADPVDAEPNGPARKPGTGD